MKRSFSFLLVALFLMLTKAASAATWYVRPDGGTRYSSAMTSGQCNGQADTPYPGQGVNQPCAFKDARYLYNDGSYATGSSFPAWGWVIAGGDTVILRGSIGTGVSYRIGWNNTPTPTPATLTSTGAWRATPLIQGCRPLRAEQPRNIPASWARTMGTAAPLRPKRSCMVAGELRS